MTIVSQELRQLKRFQARGDVSSLCLLLEHEQPEVRRSAAQSLGELDERTATGPLQVALADEVWYVRKQAALALGALADRQATTALIRALEDEDWRVRSGAAAALGQLGDLAAVEPLIQRLDDEHVEVQRIAAVSLGKLGDARAIQPLHDLRDREHSHNLLREELAGPLYDLIHLEEERQWFAGQPAVAVVSPAPAAHAAALEPTASLEAPSSQAVERDVAAPAALEPAAGFVEGPPDTLDEPSGPAVPESLEPLDEPSGPAVPESLEPLAVETEEPAPHRSIETPVNLAVQAIYAHTNKLIKSAATDREIVESLVTTGLDNQAALSVLRGTHAARARSRRQSAISTMTSAALGLAAGLLVLFLIDPTSGLHLLGYLIVLVAAIFLVRGVMLYTSAPANELDQLLAEAAAATTVQIPEPQVDSWRAAGQTLLGDKALPALSPNGKEG